MIETETRIIPLECDRVFKSIMGNPKHINILTRLLSEYLEIPYEELLGKVEVQNPEIPLMNVNEKMKTADLVVKINGDYIINIEINLLNKNTSRVKNFIYLNSLYTLKYNKGEIYHEKGLTLQINFSNFNISRECLRETFYIQDEKGNKYVKDYRIDNINIAYAREKCYNKVNLTNLEKWCLILTSVSLEELEELLGEMDMEDKDNLKESLFELTNDEKLSLYYDEEKEKEKMFKTGLAYALEKGIKKGIKDGLKRGIEQGEELGLKKGKEIGITQRNKEIVLNMLQNHIDKGIISKCTNLSISEIDKLEKC